MSAAEPVMAGLWSADGIRQIAREEIESWWRGGRSVTALRELGLRDSQTPLQSDDSLDESDDRDADVEVQGPEVVVVLKQLQVLDQLSADGQVIRHRGQLWVLNHESSPPVGSSSLPSVGEGAPGPVPPTTGPGSTEFQAQTAAAVAVMDWLAADEARAFIGCTPAMVTQIAIQAYTSALADG